MNEYDLKIFAKNIEPQALQQIFLLLKQKAFSQSKIRIMPDVHAGIGCVIGFTGDLGEKVIPNIVGVDIGCGVYVVNLGQIDINLLELDKIIYENIPSGFNVHSNENSSFDLKNLECYSELKNLSRIAKSLGTLGGGNHFIEVGIDKEKNKYLIIHTGSRNLGNQVANIYQKKAIEYLHGQDLLDRKIKETINEYKKEKRFSEIEEKIKEIKEIYQPKSSSTPKELCYLEKQERWKYLFDMNICQNFARKNRETIANTILSSLKINPKKTSSFESVHNYIDLQNNLVRKGAISAAKDELLIIPINMRDGCILGRGKGNLDWNESAPHGAGRLMSRSQAKKTFSLEDYQKEMEGIFTTSVNINTLDEAPFAYKSLQEIKESIADTVDIIDVIKPIYSFKASK